jgi:hypothetical protein
MIDSAWYWSALFLRAMYMMRGEGAKVCSHNIKGANKYGV